MKTGQTVKKTDPVVVSNYKKTDATMDRKIENNTMRKTAVNPYTIKNREKTIDTAYKLTVESTHFHKIESAASKLQNFPQPRRNIPTFNTLRLNFLKEENSIAGGIRQQNESMETPLVDMPPMIFTKRRKNRESNSPSEENKKIVFSKLVFQKKP